MKIEVEATTEPAGIKRGTYPVERPYIGCSEFATVLGLDSYCSPFELWLKKTGRVAPEVRDSKPAKWGNLLEDLVTREWAAQKGIKVRRMRRALVHPQYPFIQGHIDRRVEGEKWGVDAKTVNAFDGYNAEKWGPTESDTYPHKYRLQCLGYMGLSHWRRWSIAALIGGQDDRDYEVPWDESLYAEAIHAAVSFWRLVEKDEPPESMTLSDARLRFVDPDQNKSVIATPEIIDVYERYRRLDHDVSAYAEEIEHLKARLADFMGEAVVLTTNDHELATWKADKNGKRSFRFSKAEKPIRITTSTPIVADYEPLSTAS